MYVLTFQAQNANIEKPLNKLDGSVKEDDEFNEPWKRSTNQNRMLNLDCGGPLTQKTGDNKKWPRAACEKTMLLKKLAQGLTILPNCFY